MWRLIRPVVLWLLPIVVLLSIVQSSGVDMLTVRSASMTPTIGVGERVLVDKTAYGVMVPFSSWRSDRPARLGGPSTPSRGDIVALFSDDGAHRILVKRVVGIPGDPVPIGDRSSATVIPAGHIYVLGDNRAASVDSRHWGPVALHRVIGRVVQL
jgi:signal peptidase I